MHENLDAANIREAGIEFSSVNGRKYFLQCGRK
jgi:hypothetical protein